MVILTEDGNQYEVRIKRVPQNTYFKEHIKVGDREKPDAIQCDRYIVGEQDQQYAIEITIKKGFQWDNFGKVAMGLFLPGCKYPVAVRCFHKSRAIDIGTIDVSVDLECINHASFSDFRGAPFSFKNLAIGLLYS
jgi:hypothetical protein